MIDEKLGKTRKTLQGFNTRVVRYIDDNNVFVLITETKEVIKTDWKTFSRGLLRTDLSKVHKDEDCKHHHDHARHDHARHTSWLTRLKRWLLRLWHRILGL